MLAGAAVLSAFVYYLFFVRPFGLLERVDQPLLDLFKLSKTDPQARERLIAGYLILGVLYWLGLRAAQQAHGRAAWGIVLGGALASATILLFLYPFGAADIFDNIMHGRILGVYGGNPFRDVIGQFDRIDSSATRHGVRPRRPMDLPGSCWPAERPGWLIGPPDWFDLVSSRQTSKPNASPYSPTSSRSSSSARPPLLPAAASWQSF